MSLLTASERKKAGVLLSVMMLIAGLDALGVASILPFMGVLANLTWFRPMSRSISYL